MADHPVPLVPPEVDLRDFGYMPLDVRRLLTSETWIEAGEDPRLGHALMSLWAESWHQVPAGSLPDNDVVLYRLSMCPSRDEWNRIRDRALSGWIRCSDGLLYHPVVAEKALEAWRIKTGHRDRTKKATEERERRRHEKTQNQHVATNVQRNDERDVQRYVQRDVERNGHQGNRSEEKLTTSTKRKESCTQPPPTPKGRGARAVDKSGSTATPVDNSEDTVSSGPGPQNGEGGNGHGHGTPAGDAAKAMRNVGLADANPQHPKLLALLEAGITVGELEDAARDAAARRKSFAYALAVAHGRREDAAQLGKLPALGPIPLSRNEQIEQRAKVAGTWPARGGESWDQLLARTAAVEEAGGENAGGG